MRVTGGWRLGSRRRIFWMTPWGEFDLARDFRCSILRNRDALANSDSVDVIPCHQIATGAKAEAADGKVRHANVNELHLLTATRTLELKPHRTSIVIRSGE